jgi:hypothetical protein
MSHSCTVQAACSVQSTRPERYSHWTNGCVNSCVNSPEDGPVGPKHVEISRYMNKIEIVTFVGFLFHMLKNVCKNYRQIWLLAGTRLSQTRFRVGKSKGSEGPKCVMATFDTDRPFTDSMQSIFASIQKLPDSVVEWVSRLRHSVD